MHTKVVHRVARALEEAQHLVLRFNFRGVGASEGTHDRGIGEQDDARAALDWITSQAPGLRVTMAGFLLCDDLIFTSRIIGTAKALGLTLRALKSPEELLRFAGQRAPRCVIIDLHAPDLSIGEFVRVLVASTPRPLLVVT